MKKRNLQARKNRLFFLFISPWLIGFVGITVFPMIYSLLLSFSDSRIGTFTNFVGFQNFVHAFTGDRLFFTSIRNTLYYVVVFVPVSMITGIGIAMVLNQKLRGRSFYRVAFYIPSICAGVAVTILWGWIFNPSFGLLNYYLSFVGIEGPGWLSDPSWAMISIIIMNLWTQGNTIIIFLAGLQDIPEQLYESAMIDGASWWRRTMRITLPMLSPTLFFNLVLGLIAAFQMFNQPFILTGGTGGPVDSLYVYMLAVYNNAFRFGNMGYATALAWMLLVFIFAVTMLVVKSSKYWVYYSED